MDNLTGTKVIEDHFGGDAEVKEVAMYALSTIHVNEALMRAIALGRTEVTDVPPEALLLMRSYDNGMIKNEFWRENYVAIKSQLALDDLKLHSMNNFLKYYQDKGDKAALKQVRAILLAATLFQIAASTLQLIAYYNLHDNAVDQRDAKIDKQIEFMEELNEYECGPDLEMLNCKKDVLADLELPLVDMCSFATKCKDEVLNDGVAVDNKSKDFIEQSCGDIPDCWGTHDGNLYAAKAASVAGGIIANSARREQEDLPQCT